MQEVDHAIKTVLTRNADSVLDLAFGKRRTIKLIGLADPQINIPELKEFLPFLPLLHRHRDPRTLKVQKKMLAQITDPELREDLTAATILVALHAFGAEVVRAEFTKKELRMVKNVDFVQDWLIESLQKGERQGQRLGLQKGKLSVVEVILQQKLGALSPRLRSRLQKLDNKKLDRLTVKLQQITSQKDLQSWLNNGASNGASRHASR